MRPIAIIHLGYNFWPWKEFEGVHWSPSKTFPGLKFSCVCLTDKKIEWSPAKFDKISWWFENLFHTWWLYQTSYWNCRTQVTSKCFAKSRKYDDPNSSKLRSLSSHCWSKRWLSRLYGFISALRVESPAGYSSNFRYFKKIPDLILLFILICWLHVYEIIYMTRLHAVKFWCLKRMDIPRLIRFY